MENLEPVKYNMVISLMRRMFCDFPHALRALKDVDWDIDSAAIKIQQEVIDFREGRISFGPNKEIINAQIDTK